MKSPIPMLLICFLVMDAEAFLEHLMNNGIGFGGGLGNVNWKKDGHSTGSMLGGGFDLNLGGFPISANAGLGLGAKQSNGFGGLFQHLGGGHATAGNRYSMEENNRGKKVGMGYGRGKGEVYGNDIILGEGYGRRGLGVGHGRGVVMDRGGFKGEGQGLGLGFGLGNAQGYGRGPNLGKINEFLSHWKR